jgi:type II secretion system protein H
MRHDGGFTLVEILVVLVILGLSVTFLTLGFQRLEDDRLEKQAGQFSAWLQNVSDEAVLDSAVYGIWQKPEKRDLQVGYFLDNRWWPVTGDDMAAPTLEEGTSLLLKQGNNWLPLKPQVDAPQFKPDIVFLPTGMALPAAFQLREEVQKATRSASIERDEDGLFVWAVQ